MLERDFYKLSNITSRDKQFLESGLIATAPDPIRDLIRETIQTLSFPTIIEGNMRLTTGTPEAEALKKYLQDLTVELQEKLHQEIEANAIPIIQQLRHKNVDFLQNEQESMHFFRYIGHQYLRTKKMRDRSFDYLLGVVDGEDFSHLRNVYCFCYATIIGFMLHVFKEKLEFRFLDNASDVGFITGDQPVVNLLMDNGLDPPQHLVMYYPLKPDRALLLSFRGCGMKMITLDKDSIRMFNNAIAYQSEYAIISNSDSVLKCIRDDPPSTPPSFHHLFEDLTYNPTDP